MKQIQQPKTFISCSLRKEDEQFISGIIKITEKMGFKPFGTIGKYAAAPMPIWKQMRNAIKRSDCVILIATPRYLLQDLYDKQNTGKSISEMLHVELGMAIASNCPVLVFVEKGTDVGKFISSYVQYIELDLNDRKDLDNKTPLIANYFRSALTIIQEKWRIEKKANIWDIIKSVLVIIGGATLLSSIFDDDYYEDY